MRRRHDLERTLQALVTRLGDSVESPPEPDLRRAARIATAEPRQPQARTAAVRRPWRPLRLRWAVAAAGLLLVATGLGFGFGTWLTPAGTAGSDVAGLGFLPAKGWTVVQADLRDSADSTRAIAANVPIQEADPERQQPQTTLRAWPPWAIVIVATLRVRGDAHTDASFPVRSLPLNLADAAPAGGTDYELRAAVGGYNVDVSITFASAPTPGRFRAAQRQLERLVVAADDVTIAVRPTIAAHFDPVTVYGSISTGKSGEKVTVQFKQCGLYPVQFRDAAEVTTSDGGGWSTQLGVDANGTYRAAAGGSVSNEVKVLKRADVRLSPTRFGKFQVSVVGKLSFWHKRVTIERFDRNRGWLKVRTVLLTDSGGAGLYVWSTSPMFKLGLPKGTTIRATLPLAQAKPCYIAGISTLLRA